MSVALPIPRGHSIPRRVPRQQRTAAVRPVVLPVRLAAACRRAQGGEFFAVAEFEFFTVAELLQRVFSVSFFQVPFFSFFGSLVFLCFTFRNFCIFCVPVFLRFGFRPFFRFLRTNGLSQESPRSLGELRAFLSKREPNPPAGGRGVPVLPRSPGEQLGEPAAVPRRQPRPQFIGEPVEVPAGVERQQVNQRPAVPFALLILAAFGGRESGVRRAFGVAFSGVGRGSAGGSAKRQRRKSFAGLRF